MPLMCANYTPVTSRERLRSGFAVDLDAALAQQAWPGHAAPFLRQAREREVLARDVDLHEVPAREACIGLFGLVPHWSKDLSIGRRTYNARSETVAEKPSFRDAWRLGRRCIVPAEDIFEPSWETGSAVRWRIRRRDGEPLGIAGLWSAWIGPDGRSLLSFTMLTINADGHELMRRFHRPDDEKRMVVVLREEEYDAWLHTPRDRMATFLTAYPAQDLEAIEAPLPKRGRPAA
jgi:putative SOS response-associated peptidase YedK